MANSAFTEEAAGGRCATPTRLGFEHGKVRAIGLQTIDCDGGRDSRDDESDGEQDRRAGALPASGPTCLSSLSVGDNVAAMPCQLTDENDIELRRHAHDPRIRHWSPATVTTLPRP